MNILAAVELAVAAAIAVYVILNWDSIADVDADRQPAADAVEPDRRTPRHVLVCVAPDGIEIELPVASGWDEDSILTTVAQIEAL